MQAALQDQTLVAPKQEAPTPQQQQAPQEAREQKPADQPQEATQQAQPTEPPQSNVVPFNQEEQQSAEVLTPTEPEASTENEHSGLVSMVQDKLQKSAFLQEQTQQMPQEELEQETLQTQMAETPKQPLPKGGMIEQEQNQETKPLTQPINKNAELSAALTQDQISKIQDIAEQMSEPVEFDTPELQPAAVKTENDYVGNTIAPSATIAKGTQIGIDVEIGHRSTVGMPEDNSTQTSGATLADGVKIGNEVTIGAGAELQEDVTIGNRSEVAEGVRIGGGNTVNPDTIITKDVPSQNGYDPLPPRDPVTGEVPSGEEPVAPTPEEPAPEVPQEDISNALVTGEATPEMIEAMTDNEKAMYRQIHLSEMRDQIDDASAASVGLNLEPSPTANSFEAKLEDTEEKMLDVAQRTAELQASTETFNHSMEQYMLADGSATDSAGYDENSGLYRNAADLFAAMDEAHNSFYSQIDPRPLAEDLWNGLQSEQDDRNAARTGRILSIVSGVVGAVTSLSAGAFDFLEASVASSHLRNGNIVTEFGSQTDRFKQGEKIIDGIKNSNDLGVDITAWARQNGMSADAASIFAPEGSPFESTMSDYHKSKIEVANWGNGKDYDKKPITKTDLDAASQKLGMDLATSLETMTTAMDNVSTAQANLGAATLLEEARINGFSNSYRDPDDIDSNVSGMFDNVEEDSEELFSTLRDLGFEVEGDYHRKYQGRSLPRAELWLHSGDTELLGYGEVYFRTSANGDAQGVYKFREEPSR